MANVLDYDMVLNSNSDHILFLTNTLGKALLFPLLWVKQFAKFALAVEYIDYFSTNG